MWCGPAVRRHHPINVRQTMESTGLLFLQARRAVSLRRSPAPAACFPLTVPAACFPADFPPPPFPAAFPPPPLPVYFPPPPLAADFPSPPFPGYAARGIRSLTLRPAYPSSRHLSRQVTRTAVPVVD